MYYLLKKFNKPMTKVSLFVSEHKKEKNQK